jgi:CRISPR/Cas system-associated exonuclease Cas4 (RecB family)
MAFVKASEISDFVFCERKWWLEKRDYFGQLQPQDAALVTERLSDGTEFHQTYFKNVRYASAGRSAARKLVILSLFLLLIMLFFLFFEQAHGAPSTVRSGAQPQGTKGQKVVAPVKRPQDRTTKKAQILLGLVAAAVLVIAFLLRLLGRRRERRWQMPPGPVISLDVGNARTLVCNELGLVGKPDVVRCDGQFFVPEERKSRILQPGRVPFRNDILQVAAYCYLVAKNLGTVQKGILIYRNGQRYEVPFTNELMDELRQVLNRMRSMQSVEVVHRSHQMAARCSGCVARNMCFEALS